MKTITAVDIYGSKHEIDILNLRWRPSAYAVVIKNGCVLVLPAFGRYALAGGGIELGESIEQALHREVREETGVNVEIKRLLGAESNFFILPGKSEKGNCIQSLLLYYECEYVSGELSSEYFDDNEKDYGSFPEWLPLEKLSQIKLASSVDWRIYINKVSL